MNNKWKVGDILFGNSGTTFLICHDDSNNLYRLLYLQSSRVLTFSYTSLDILQEDNNDLKLLYPTVNTGFEGKK